MPTVSRPSLSCGHELAEVVADVYYCPECDSVYCGPCGNLVPDICPVSRVLARRLYQLLEEVRDG